MTKKITVHSDGFGGSGTVIIDEEGNTLEGVSGVNIFIEAGSVNSMSLDVPGTPVIVEGLITGIEAKCPGCHAALSHSCDDQLGGPDDRSDEEVEYQIVGYTNPSGMGSTSMGMVLTQMQIGSRLKFRRVDPK